nr:amidohydrolase family protein [Deinococcota bacterium]
PRGYGCFARVLRLCVRELGAISLPEAIYKMSGFPAERFRIKDRGFVRRGLAADLVIFDPETVADRATWDQPRREPVGIDVVMVNGVVVCEQGKPTGALPGRVIR